ncbi:MAG: hypothetical protein IRZ31_02835 [Thermogemmatispora sp.]|uniref:hypothetical protein n=1 Tax=Thermogemmatispora sp. TaxID=1968838 RepID=UPI002604F686|nr:hypothetical protein [Thermogemmatispora sp.]MBX5455814.1 hypothetical protein [Thermogemmatispora sp.]
MTRNAVSLGQTLPPEEVWRRLRFAANGLEIVPNPPRVGETVSIRLLLCNEAGEPLTVQKATPRIYYFGMGSLKHENLPALGPVTLPADPSHIEALSWQWLPSASGHRCLRVSLEIEGWSEPWVVGCNLNVINAPADAYRWAVPFRLGNPTEKAQPLRLRLNLHSTGLGEEAFRAWVELPQDGSRLVPGQPLWLRPHEEREALLVIRAHRFATEAFELVSDVEAWLGDTFLDGIRVVVQRSAPVAPFAALGTQPLEESLLISIPVGVRDSEA